MAMTKQATLLLLLRVGVGSLQGSAGASMIRARRIGDSQPASPARQLLMDDEVAARHVGNNGIPSKSFPLGLCEGDCDDDAECAGDLVCFERLDDEPIPGCTNVDGKYDRVDFCINSNIISSTAAPVSSDSRSDAPSMTPNVHVPDDDDDPTRMNSTTTFDGSWANFSSAGRTEIGSSAPSTTPSVGQLDALAALDPPNTLDSDAVTGDGKFEPNPLPDRTTRGYFNYNTTDGSRYGPDRWRKIDTRYSYFREFGSDGFGAWDRYLSSPTKNRCDSKDYSWQSPMDLWPSKDGAGCDEIHMIRTRNGTYPLPDVHIKKRIESNKLSVVLNRRLCRDLSRESCKEDYPPRADFPRYTDGNSDMLSFDIKVPSEHWLEGEQFDAEIQMLHAHQTSARMASIGVLIRATTDGFNPIYQEILDEFQIVFDKDMAECAFLTGGGRRRADAQVRDSEHSIPNEPKLGEHGQRELRGLKFHPYHELIMRTIWFYRYNGSTTDPPCYPITWTSVHFNESVARPLQRVEGRDVTKCTVDDFVSDAEKRGE